ncbi:MAG: hypothetical protein ACI9J3_002602 [Parvicellaceae bacterium]|jgi:hypothetical protein
MYEGITGRFWLNLVLYAVGLGVALVGLIAILAVVHALLIVLDVI